MKWRLVLKDPGQPGAVFDRPIDNWLGLLNRYIAAHNNWLLESVEPGRIVFIGRGSITGSTATFTYGPVP